jgi:hypothetical protein
LPVFAYALISSRENVFVRFFFQHWAFAVNDRTHTHTVVDTVTEESNDYLTIRNWSLMKSYDYFATYYCAVKKVTIISSVITWH